MNKKILTTAIFGDPQLAVTQAFSCQKTVRKAKQILQKALILEIKKVYGFDIDPKGLVTLRIDPPPGLTPGLQFGSHLVLKITETFPGDPTDQEPILGSSPTTFYFTTPLPSPSSLDMVSNSTLMRQEIQDLEKKIEEERRQRLKEIEEERKQRLRLEGEMRRMQDELTHIVVGMANPIHLRALLDRGRDRVAQLLGPNMSWPDFVASQANIDLLQVPGLSSGATILLTNPNTFRDAGNAAAHESSPPAACYARARVALDAAVRTDIRATGAVEFRFQLDLSTRSAPKLPAHNSDVSMRQLMPNVAAWHFPAPLQVEERGRCGNV
ncbi:hypothetical protein B0H13DRAFT_1905952 [Mycena leptocephala]|nr:hypothetical protein B0H13DRAFT_1905952 [Mycena leptocephala]